MPHRSPISAEEENMKNAWFLAFSCMAAALAGCNTSLQRNMPDAYSSGPQDVVSALIESPAFLLADRRASEGVRQKDSVFSMVAVQHDEAADERGNAGEGSEAQRVLQLSRVHALTAYDVLAGGAVKAGVFSTPQPGGGTLANLAVNRVARASRQ
jgi:hypothetical protein